MRISTATASLLAVIATCASGQAVQTAHANDGAIQSRSTVTAPISDELVVNWKGHPTDVATITDELGEEVGRIAARWALIADERDANVHLTDDGRVLLFTHSLRSKVKKELELVADTLALVDEQLPARPSPQVDAGDETASRMDDPTDTGTMVLLQAADEEEYHVLLDEVIKGEVYLWEWRTSARRLAGFTLTQPLVAMWIESLDGQEEWDIRNELVHRLAHMTVARRFGELPYWLQMGFNWHFEEELLSGIYCFPYRSQFVYATEHSSWPSDLAKDFRNRKKPYFEDLANWRRGSYQGEQARQAFGFARFLLTHHQEQTPQMLANLFHLRATQGVVVRADGGWELIPGWEAEPDRQAQLIEGILGEDGLEQAALYFEKGKRYKKPKRRS